MSETPRTVDEWIRECAKNISTEARLFQKREGYSEEDMADTIDDYEFIIRAHLVKAGLITSLHPPQPLSPTITEG